MAVNWRDSEAAREMVAGVSETVTGGLRVTLALADLLESAVLVAVTVTFCRLVMDAGSLSAPPSFRYPYPDGHTDTCPKSYKELSDLGEESL